jgi:ATP synthase protein I
MVVSRPYVLTARVPAQMSHSSDSDGRNDPDGPGRAESRRPAQGFDDGYSIIAYLLSGAILFGGGGWALDTWLGTGFLLPVGLVVGAALSVYLIYVRLGLR